MFLYMGYLFRNKRAPNSIEKIPEKNESLIIWSTHLKLDKNLNINNDMGVDLVPVH